ncbi:hypothetical protein E1A91_D06G099400v1 [Gossypium mustelinum]|uniref:Protein kinase domain-containing protein n=1 Tax=Gossypium mustelinum TaxID=34275 RepID=A0A5D2UJS4_GOSMU|nr:hypothetical protein E1A91_D06G099400v1 [Gossypium mustelinum]
MQAHIPPPPGYFVQLENPDGLFLKKRMRMRRWLCCSCQVKENYQSRENEHLKCNSDGICYFDLNFFFMLIFLLDTFVDIEHQNNSKVVSPIKPEERKSSSLIEVPALSLEELKEKIDNFGSNALIGEGSYGRVYYANLNDGKTMDVKKLDVSTERNTLLS